MPVTASQYLIYFVTAAVCLRGVEVCSNGGEARACLDDFKQRAGCQHAGRGEKLNWNSRDFLVIGSGD